MHPDRRREGRRIRKKNRAADEKIVSMLRSPGFRRYYEAAEAAAAAYAAVMEAMVAQFALQARMLEEWATEQAIRSLSCAECANGYHEACAGVMACMCPQHRGTQEDYVLII